MIRWVAVCVAGLWLGLGLTPIAEAHLKDYLVTQDYYTAKRGEFEVALWNDMNFPEADNDGTYNTKHQIELEYGLLDHLQVSYYEVYAWDRAEDWSRDEFKIETKYRFADAGQWPLDAALYAEYANPNGHRATASDELEGKLILSRDVGPWNAAVNLIAGKPINTGSPWAYEYTAGISYALTARTRLGLEIKQGLGDSRDFDVSKQQPLYLVPGIYTSLTPHVRVLVGPAFGLTRVSDDVQLKSIVEIEF